MKSIARNRGAVLAVAAIAVPVEPTGDVPCPELGGDPTFVRRRRGLRDDGESYDRPRGRAGELTVPSLEAGAYDALCTVPGHDGLGMVATVLASDDPTADGGAQATSHTASSMTAEQMAQMHVVGVAAFPAAAPATRC